jgi:hypothetical protein
MYVSSYELLHLRFLDEVDGPGIECAEHTRPLLQNSSIYCIGIP